MTTFRYINVALVLALASSEWRPQQVAAEAKSPSFVYVCRDAGAGGYQAFPDVCRLKDGRLMCAFYASYHHIGLPCPEHPQGGRIACCISTDEGHSWSKPATLYDGPDDDRDPSIVQLKDGRVICNFFTIHRKTAADKPCPDPFKEPYAASGTWIVASNNAGKSWSDPRKLYETYYCSSPVRELSNGRLIMPLYSETEGPKATAFGAVGISEDGGKTWGKPIDIDNAGVRLDAETDVIELADGRLWAGQRSSHTPACYAVSADEGNTWTKSQTLGFVAHCPYLLRAASNPSIILMGYRGYSTLNGSGVGCTALRCSLDECKTWNEAITVDAFVGAYPSMVNLKDGSVLIVYYEEANNSSIRAKRFRVTSAGVEWLAP
jgi:sialidase-1